MSTSAPGSMTASRASERLLTKNNVSSSDFLPMLVALGQVLKVSNNTRIEGLSFRNNTLDVQLSAPDVAVLDKIQKQVADTGFQVQIQAANPKDDRVEGRLEIKGSGA